MKRETGYILQKEEQGTTGSIEYCTIEIGFVPGAAFQMGRRPG